MSSSVAQDPSSRVVTRARIGFRARVTYFELGCPETNIDPDKSISSSVAQKQILILFFYNLFLYFLVILWLTWSLLILRIYFLFHLQLKALNLMA